MSNLTYENIQTMVLQVEDLRVRQDEDLKVYLRKLGLPFDFNTDTHCLILPMHTKQLFEGYSIPSWLQFSSYISEENMVVCERFKSILSDSFMVRGYE